ncbi:MAG: GGDEF domain-containing phosphodiesterase [Acholeplasmataceae bacterium]|nr:GGDEF domain-containing phosphodiesterase [Acholeplasmataceae bacterium]
MSKYTIREIIVMGIFLLAILVVGLLILNKQDIDEVNLLVSASNEEIVDHIFYQANAKKTLLEENRLTLTTYDLPFDAGLFTDIQVGIPSEYNLSIPDEVFVVIYYVNNKLYYEPIIPYLQIHDRDENHFAIVDEIGTVLLANKLAVGSKIASYVKQVSIFDDLFQTHEPFSFLDNREFIASTPIVAGEYYFIYFTARTIYFPNNFKTVVTQGLIVLAFVMMYVLIVFINNISDARMQASLNHMMIQNLPLLYVVEVDKKGKILSKNKLFENLVHRENVKNIHELLDDGIFIDEHPEILIHIHDEDMIFTRYSYKNRYLLIAEKVTAVIKDYEQAVYFDADTKLANKASFIKYMEELDRHTAMTILVFDIKEFRKIRNLYGLNYVNQLVMFIAGYFEHILDVGLSRVFLIKDDTFAIVSQREYKINTRAWIFETIQKLNELLAENKYLTISFSVAISPVTPEILENPETIPLYLMTALDQAKENEENDVAFYDEDLRTFLNEREKIISDIEKGIKQNEFEIYLQPTVDLKSKAITSYEALMRWNNPAYFYISPEKYFSLAEETKLIYDLTSITVNQTAKLISELDNPKAVISFNASPMQLLEQGFIHKITQAVKKEKINLDQLAVEITETSFSKSFSKVIEKINAIKKLGLKIYIDDFGTGYSSLKYLSDLDLDVLKIDKSFVEKMVEDNRVEAIVKTIIHLAHNLKLKVIAEGVETKAQLALLQKLNCDHIQGYLVSKAIPSQEAVKLFHRKVNI